MGQLDQPNRNRTLDVSLEYIYIVSSVHTQ
jgi:hypothetical protein